LLTAAGGNYLVDYSLDEIEEKVNPAKFFRVSRKYIINIDFIDDIIAYSGSRLKIKLNVATENDIIVSRQRVKEFRSWIGLGKG
jgi:DNA-binding LytR/AlgR family response regulator